MIRRSLVPLLLVVAACQTALEGAPIAQPDEISARGFDDAIEVTWSTVPGAAGYLIHMTGPNGIESPTPVPAPPFTVYPNGSGYGVPVRISVSAQFGNAQSLRTPEVEIADFRGHHAPLPRYRFAGGQAGARFGSALAAGDFNADGRPDLAIGSPEFDNGSASTGLVAIRPGVAGGLSTSFEMLLLETAPGARFGASLAAGDVLGGPAIDLVGGLPGISRAMVATGGFSFSFNYENRRYFDGAASSGLGSCVAIVGDQVAVGAPSEGASGAVRLFSAPGSTSTVVVPGAAAAEFGSAIASGDFDADGSLDLAVGAPASLGGAGSVFAFVGGAEYRFDGSGSGRLGASLAAGAFTYEEPGYDDLAAGEPDAGSVVLLHSTSGTLRRTGGEIVSLPGSALGAALTASYQADSTQADEVFAGAPLLATPRPVRLTPGCRDSDEDEDANNDCTFTEFPLDPNPELPSGGEFGAALALIPDFNGDGLPELAVGAPAEGNGGVYVFASHPGLTPLPRAGSAQRLRAPAAFVPAGATFEDPVTEGRWRCDWEPDDPALAAFVIDPCTPENAGDVSFAYTTPGTRWPQLRVTSLPDGRYGVSRVRVVVE